MKSNFFESSLIKRATMSKIVGGLDITDLNENPEHTQGIAAPDSSVVGIGSAVAVGITGPDPDYDEEVYGTGCDLVG